MPVMCCEGLLAVASGDGRKDRTGSRARRYRLLDQLFQQQFRPPKARYREPLGESIMDRAKHGSCLCISPLASHQLSKARRRKRGCRSQQQRHWHAARALPDRPPTHWTQRRLLRAEPRKRPILWDTLVSQPRRRGLIGSADQTMSSLQLIAPQPFVCDHRDRASAVMLHGQRTPQSNNLGRVCSPHSARHPGCRRGLAAAG